jgi:ssDNA-binding Zn-finger/Zn-ribbon topoisomerase 1
MEVICPYCGGQAHLQPDRTVYNKPYGRMVWVCENFPHCNAFVGSHHDGTPFGSLANKPLRIMRRKAHDCFDPLWLTEKLYVRKIAYKYLAMLMDIPEEECHIGHFNYEQCQQVIELVPELRRIAKRNNFKVIFTRKSWNVETS